MPDPLAEAGAHGAVPYLLSFAVALATSIAGAIGGALRFSGRIAGAEDAAKKADARAALAEAAAGKLADEIKAIRAERPSQPLSEAEIQRRIEDVVERATKRLGQDVERLHAAAERGLENHHQVELLVTRLSVALERDR